MYSIPIAITIKLIIREIAFIPEAPKYFTIKWEFLRTANVARQTAEIVRTAIIRSE